MAVTYQIDAEQGDRVTVLRTAAIMILKLENPLESLEDRIRFI